MLLPLWGPIALGILGFSATIEWAANQGFAFTLFAFIPIVLVWINITFLLYGLEFLLLHLIFLPFGIRLIKKTDEIKSGKFYPARAPQEQIDPSYTFGSERNVGRGPIGPAPTTTIIDRNPEHFSGGG